MSIQWIFELNLRENATGYERYARAHPSHTPNQTSMGSSESIREVPWQSFELTQESASWSNLEKQIVTSLTRELKSSQTAKSVQQTNAEGEIQALGQALYTSAFSGEVLSLFEKTIAKFDDQDSLLLQLRLNGKRLEQLPWEVMHDGRNFIALDKQISIVRYLEHGEPVKLLNVYNPLRILFVSALPKETSNLAVEEEYRRLVATLENRIIVDDIELALLPNATLSSLNQKLSQEQFHVVHIAGHATKENKGTLLLENEQGEAEEISAAKLAMYLSQRGVALVILNACEGAIGSSNNQVELSPFSGLAQSLVQHGIPAVVAMQLQITDTAALQFSESFYENLVRTGHLGRALDEARLSIFTKSLEWLTPVLFSRTVRQDLLNTKELTEQEKSARVLVLKENLIDAETAKDWPTALLCLKKLEIYSFTDASLNWVSDKKDYVQEQLEFPENLQKVKTFLGNGEIEEAERLVIKLNNLAPDNSLLNEFRNQISKELYGTSESTVAEVIEPDTVDLYEHINDIIKAIEKNKLVFVLGPEMQATARASGDRFQPRQNLPNEAELVKYLTKDINGLGEITDLSRAAQAYVLEENQETLDEELVGVFSATNQVGRIHQFISALDDYCKKKHIDYQPIVISYSLDNMILKAFQESGDDFDLFTPAHDANNLTFIHSKYVNREWQEEIRANDYDFDSENKRIIIQLNARLDPEDGSFINYFVTEDQHIEVFKAKMIDQLPSSILGKLRRRSKFLFLGASFNHWYVRGVFRYIWGEKSSGSMLQSWAISSDEQQDEMEQRLWTKHRVKVINSDIQYFITELENAFKQESASS